MNESFCGTRTCQNQPGNDVGHAGSSARELLWIICNSDSSGISDLYFDLADNFCCILMKGKRSENESVGLTTKGHKGKESAALVQ